MGERILTASSVESIFMECLFKDGEDTAGYVQAEGIVSNVGFHPGRLHQHRETILGLLKELPDEFQVQSGGGWSFLNACQDRHGNHWTGMHQSMEQLFQLGIAIGAARYVFPRAMWSTFPGGMPYIAVDTVPEAAVTPGMKPAR